MNLNKRTESFCRAVVLEVAKLRAESGLSQNQLSTPSGLHQTTINLLESGRRSPSVATLYRLAEALGTTPAKILASAQKKMYPVSDDSVAKSVKPVKSDKPVKSGPPRAVKKSTRSPASKARRMPTV